MSLEHEIQEFNEKAKILETFGELVSPEAFYDDLFAGDTSVNVPITLLDPAEPQHMLKGSVDKAIELSKNRNDVLIGSCTYFNSYASGKTLKDIYGFIVDMDSVSPSLLKKLLTSGWVDTNGFPIPMPTYIVNSGHGLHLVFILKEIIPAYNSSKPKLRTLYKRLLLLECYGVQEVDFAMQWIGQSFRMVGGLNKLNLENKAYKVGDYWDIDDLGVKLGIKEHFRRYGEKNPEFKIQYAPKYERKPYPVNNKLYSYALKRCYEETPVGTRYYSFVALVSLAVKTNIPKEKVAKDLEELRLHYNTKSEKKVNKSEVEYALTTYENPDARGYTAKKLEGWLGWKWEYKGKKYNRHKWAERFPKKKTDEMRENGELTSMEVYAQKKRDEMYPDRSWAGHRKSKQDVVRQWQKEHPGGKKKDCIKDTGLSNKTVYKWWEDTE